MEQFRRPQGLFGYLAGWIMATRPSNLQRNRWTVGLLDVQPRDRVLEIGFGPGVAIEACALRATDGKVLGLDHSELMNRMAASRNRKAIDEGRVELRLGTLATLGAADGLFDKMISVNCAQFWDDPAGALLALQDRLAPGGTLALTYQPRHPGATNADADKFADRVTTQAIEAGFSSSRKEKLDLKPIGAVCVLLAK